MQKNARSRRVVLLALLALACLPAAAAAAVPAPPARTAGSPPRIFLDATTLAKLKTRALAGDSAWIALRNACDAFNTNPSTVHFPDDEANAYPDDGGIGKGYQGIGYYPPMMNLGLCYQVATAIGDTTRASRYAGIGMTLLDHISRPATDPHHQDPLEDQVYDIRFFATAMATGYDWFYPAMSPALRTQVATSLKVWIDAFEQHSFAYPFPQGNYFAGYYEAKALAGMALANDSDTTVSGIGNGILSDWFTRIQGKSVQPYYAANLAGGGWSEGWNYGPFASQNMSLPALAAKTALGVDLVDDPLHPYRYPVSDARFLLYFAWPNMRSLEDADKVSNGENPAETLPFMYTSANGILTAFGDPFAPYFASFANRVRQLQHGNELFDDWDTWQNFLFWDPKQPMKSYRTLPLSYKADGIEMAAVRSDWSTNAAWASFKAGTFTNNPDNGEEWRDQGSLEIMNGSAPLLVTASGAALRDSYPPDAKGNEQDDSHMFETPVQNNAFYGRGDIFNLFYSQPAGGSPGQSIRLRSEGARTRITQFHDAGPYVTMTGSHLEDMFPGGKVSFWTRQVVLVRPGVFVVYDRTAIPNAANDQWLAFHFERQPTPRAGGTGGAQRYEVRGPHGYGGNVDTVLPLGHRDKMATLWTSAELKNEGESPTEIIRDEAKIMRLEIRPATTAPGQTATTQDWLTVFDAAKSPSRSFLPAPLKAVGERAGVLLHRHDDNEAIVLGGNGARYVRYSVPRGPTLHVVGGLKPGASYTLRYRGGAVDLRQGPGLSADSAGILTFRTR